MSVSGNDLAFHSLRNISVLCARFRQDRIVINFHVCLGDVTDRYDAFQLPVPCDRERMYIRFLHLLPCCPDGNAASDAFHLFQLCIFDLLPEIRKQPRRLHVKTLQHILRLFVELPGAARFINLSCDLRLQCCISDRRTDRIRIRILMSHYIYLIFISFIHSILSPFL